ncbi:hypothetical protein BC938DRAFT_483678 [Jimgerdemannia flammicorona]|uniref:Uncharacterized protein n=1 Tax=Jimgerdemannia flammicorona TaxID=994334 RepID=A0A433QVP9_9FUNG|nr:hypothetical protein BC938DRAFT_483678 [Jimgerdemannia flammicorona]
MHLGQLKITRSGLPKYARDYFSRVNPLQWSLLHFLEKTESTRPSDISKDKVHNAFYSSLRDILKVPTMKGDPVYHSRSEIASSNPQNKIAVKRFISQELLDAKVSGRRDVKFASLRNALTTHVDRLDSF